MSLRSAGKYKCEVSAEAPSFHTDTGAGRLLVVCEYDERGRGGVGLKGGRLGRERSEKKERKGWNGSGRLLVLYA